MWQRTSREADDRLVMIWLSSVVLLIPGFHTVTVSFDFHDLRVVYQAVRNRGSYHSVVIEDFRPVYERHVRGQRDRPAFIAGGDHLIQEVGAVFVDGQITEFIDLCGASHKSINVNQSIMWSSGLAGRSGAGIRLYYSTLLIDRCWLFRGSPATR